jgi:hypothetical protein
VLQYDIINNSGFVHGYLLACAKVKIVPYVIELILIVQLSGRSPLAIFLATDEAGVIKAYTCARENNIFPVPRSGRRIISFQALSLAA